MPERAPRRLAAIMFTDMVGYSALTQRNESLALELLDEHNMLIREKIAEHAGREIKTVGDAFLVEFNSALAAVQCAVGVQRALTRRNGILASKGPAAPDNTSAAAEPVHVRIGIHLGDVVYRENDVFGDGVNIAARVQSNAEGGEILVSEDVARQVQNKIDIPLQDLGPTRLKNITDPVRIFSIQADRRTRPRSVTGSGAGAPPETSIAVLAFANRSANADDEYFSDGLADELLNMLAKIDGLRVAARTSAFYFKGKTATVSEIGKTLNVATVLDGSVRKSGNRARVSVQLVKVDDGYQIWSESYDRTLEDIFAVQDDIALAVVTELRQRLL
ncbi:MAG: adenylate/guanylate cyclase domain-containing protein, partial [Betaproteobacteria bacterium]|nr:adenylate/guanylate cyclase domain-containing protein [Betaproteobacteria bacterium]